MKPSRTAAVVRAVKSFIADGQRSACTADCWNWKNGMRGMLRDLGRELCLLKATRPGQLTLPTLSLIRHLPRVGRDRPRAEERPHVRQRRRIMTAGHAGNAGDSGSWAVGSGFRS